MPLAKGLRRALPLYVALGVLFAVALTHRVRDTIARFAEVVHGDELPRLPFDLDFPGSTLSQLGPEAVEAGLRPGERLLAMDGTAVPGPAEFFERLVAALFGRTDWFQPVAAVYQPLFGNLWPVSMMLFGIYFPERLPFDRRFPWVKWLVLAPVLFRVLGTNVLTDVLVLRDPQAAATVARTFAPMLPLVGALHFVAIGAFFAASGYRAFRERRPDARRRLMLLHTGAAVALTPVCVFAVLTLAGAIEFAEWMLLPHTRSRPRCMCRASPFC